MKRGASGPRTPHGPPSKRKELSFSESNFRDKRWINDKIMCVTQDSDSSNRQTQDNCR